MAKAKPVEAAVNVDIQIERWPIERLIPRANNPRTHSRAQVASIAASMREWGWTNPILVGADDDIIAGHARLLAAEKLGMKEVPVILLKHLSPAQRRALVIADNQLAIEGAGSRTRGTRVKALVRRLTRLEQSGTRIADLRYQQIAYVLWERRQRRLQAGGLPFETIKPQYSPGPHLSYVDSLRRCLQDRRARQRAERERADNGA